MAPPLAYMPWRQPVAPVCEPRKERVCALQLSGEAPGLLFRIGGPPVVLDGPMDGCVNQGMGMILGVHSGVGSCLLDQLLFWCGRRHARCGPALLEPLGGEAACGFVLCALPLGQLGGDCVRVLTLSHVPPGA